MDEKEAEARPVMGTIFLVMNKSQESTVFGGRQKSTSAMKQGQKSDSNLILNTGMSS